MTDAIRNHAQKENGAVQQDVEEHGGTGLHLSLEHVFLIPPYPTAPPIPTPEFKAQQLAIHEPRP